MPKQIFQRPTPVNHTKIGKGNTPPGGTPDWGCKKGKSPATPPKPAPIAPTLLGKTSKKT